MKRTIANRDRLWEKIDAEQRFFAAAHIVTALMPRTIMRRPVQRVRKYDPCPCGSGKKFKFCCFGKGNR